MLFVEKEGFGPLLTRARIAEQFDIAIMSTKGMSVVAARYLIDGLPDIDKVLVLHDFDVSGFSIFGTLGSDGRRFKYKNDVRVIDIGLRLPDITEMGLDSEPASADDKKSWPKRIATLRAHGASNEEIAFLQSARVELNAMPSDVFVAFLERKLAEHGIRKVVPDDDTMRSHARRIIEEKLAEQALMEVRTKMQTEAAATQLPADLGEQVRSILADRPDLPWDEAVAAIIRGWAR